MYRRTRSGNALSSPPILDPALASVNLGTWPPSTSLRRLVIHCVRTMLDLDSSHVPSCYDISSCHAAFDSFSSSSLDVNRFSLLLQYFLSYVVPKASIVCSQNQKHDGPSRNFTSLRKLTNNPRYYISRFMLISTPFHKHSLNHLHRLKRHLLQPIALRTHYSPVKIKHRIRCHGDVHIPS